MRSVFTVLPAVDVAGGRAVRLTQGTVDESTFGAPLDIALEWQSDGAQWIHLVDLDAAFGRGSNSTQLADVIGALDVDVELTGGINDDASLRRALSAGPTRVVLSSAALADPTWCARVVATHGERIAVSLDVRSVDSIDGATRYVLAPRGAPHHGGRDLVETAELLDRAGCTRYVITDVSRDGMLQGPNMDLYRSIARTSKTPIIASGGVSSLADLSDLAQAGSDTNVDGAVVGKALYARRFTLPQALDVVRRSPSNDPTV